MNFTQIRNFKEMKTYTDDNFSRYLLGNRR